MSAPLRHLRQVSSDLPERAPEPDWAAETADRIEKVVGSIRAKTADPLDRIVRVVVYGLLAGIVGIAALTLLIAGLVRALDVAIPGHVWSVHLIIGGIFTVVGLFLWTKRRAPADDKD